MQAIRRWLARPAPSVTPGTTVATLARDDTRRELLRMAARDTLRKRTSGRRNRSDCASPRHSAGYFAGTATCGSSTSSRSRGNS